MKKGKVVQQILKNFLADLKTVFKDRVHLIMFLIAVILSCIDITGKYPEIVWGACGFLTFYILFLLSQIGGLKRQLYEKPK